MSVGLMNRLNKKIQLCHDEYHKEIMRWMSENGKIEDGIIKLSLSEYEEKIKETSCKLVESDMVMRVRKKVEIPEELRCSEHSRSGECVRGRMRGSSYCKQHSKDRPYGERKDKKIKEIEISEEKGILIYKDKEGENYSAENIIQQKLK